MTVPMTPEDIVQTRQNLQLVARTVLELFTLEQLDDFVRTCEGADAIGPYIDPTAWMAARDQLPVMVEHARALRAFRKALHTAAIHVGDGS